LRAGRPLRPPAARALRSRDARPWRLRQPGVAPWPLGCPHRRAGRPDLRDGRGERAGGGTRAGGAGAREMTVRPEAASALSDAPDGDALYRALGVRPVVNA